MLQVSATVSLASSPGQLVVRLIDISKAGVAFVSSRPLESGTPFSLSVWLPGTDGPVSVEGTIVYCLALGSGEMHRVGAKFGLMDEETLDRIRDFVSRPLGKDVEVAE